MKVALVQMVVQDGEPEKNLSHGIRLAEKASSYVDLIVFPEMWTTGYHREAIMKYAESEENEFALSKLKELARNYSVHIVSSIPHRKEGRIYDAAYLIGGNGEVIGIYRKIHLFRPYGEDKMFASGDRIGVFDTRLGRVGIAICYDLRFPELFRLMTLAGARAIFVPASWGAPRALQWRTLLRARAAENQVYMVGVNRVGSSSATGEEYIGDSSIYDPFGWEIVHSEDVEQVLIGELDLSRIENVRRMLPLWEDRRRDLYGIRNVWGIKE